MCTDPDKYLYVAMPVITFPAEIAEYSNTFTFLQPSHRDTLSAQYILSIV